MPANENDITTVMSTSPDDEVTEPDMQKASTPPEPQLPEKEKRMEKLMEFIAQNPGKIGTAGVVAFTLGVVLSSSIQLQSTPTYVQVAYSEIKKTPVHFSGGNAFQQVRIENTEFGEAAIYESIPQEATCLIVFLARKENEKPILNFPIWWMSPGSTPQQLDKPSQNGFALWVATFQGNGCLAIADTDHFIASDTHQLIKFGRGKNTMRCIDKECTTSFNLAGRDDLNFVPVDGDKPRKRKEQP